MRTLAAEHPDLDVSDEVRVALTAPKGSVLILLPQAGDADWLNLARPVFSERKLKVVLFCDHATSIALAEHAPDFYDWITQHCDCPPGPVPHAVFGLRAALAAGAPVVWQSADGEPVIERVRSAFTAAFPGQELRWIEPQYDDVRLVHAIVWAGDRWVACNPRHRVHLHRFRAELSWRRRKDRVLVVADPPSCPGFWPVHDRMVPFGEARRALMEAGASRAGALAALTGLEPEAVEIACVLLQRGAISEKEKEIAGVLGAADDPGAALVRWAEERLPGVAVSSVAIATVPSPPSLRARLPWAMEWLEAEDDRGRAYALADSVVQSRIQHELSHEPGHSAEALRVLSETIWLASPVWGADDEAFAALVSALAGVLANTGRSVEAEVLLRKLLGPEAILPGDAPYPPAKLGTMGLDPEANEALALFLARPGTRSLAAGEHVKALRRLAEALLVQGRYEEAELIVERAVDRAGALPPEHEERWRTLTTFGQILAVQGRTDAALDALRRAVERVDRYSDEKHVDRARTLGELARVERRAGKPEAAATAEHALALYAKAECSDEEKSDAEQELRPIATGARKDAALGG